MAQLWAVVVEQYVPGNRHWIGEPYVHQVVGDRDAARAAATAEALAAWGQRNEMQRRSITRALQVSSDEWLIEVAGNWNYRPCWARVSVVEVVKLPSDCPWQA
jgi:hypothetical protein